MDNKIFQKIGKLFFTLVLALGLFLPASSTMALSQKTAPLAGNADLIEVEFIIIKYRTNPDMLPSNPGGSTQMELINTETAVELAAASTTLVYERPVLSNINIHILRLSPAVSLAQARTISAALKDNLDGPWTTSYGDNVNIDELEYAAPWVQPDDPEYDTAPTNPPTDQWSLHDDWGINAPMAWGITTGSADTYVAVLDSGITLHDDLDESRILRDEGYDFIGNDAVSNDGQPGRDANSTDAGIAEGDSVRCGPSPWQGTRVAGIIGADGNNATGIAGLNWNAKIVPVRVIGGCGEVAVADLVDGMRWAAGWSVSGVPDDITHPAQVIHVSASIPNVSCGPYQSLIDTIINPDAAAVAAGHFPAVIVAAAGDTGTDAGNNFPANCTGVITVAATSAQGNRALYSNYGSEVDISAPGGGSSQGGTVLSTSNGSTTTPNANSALYDGEVERTSLAAAHVSGVVSLMFAANPKITPSQVSQILQTTAKDFLDDVCDSDVPSKTCGSGIVDAGQAVRIASMPDLVITEVALVPADNSIVADTDFNVSFKVKNQGGSNSVGDVSWNIYLNRDPLLITNKDEIGRFMKFDLENEIWEPDLGDYSTTDFNPSIPPGDEITREVPITGGLGVGVHKLYAYTDANALVPEGFENNNHYAYVTVNTGDGPAAFAKTAPINAITPLVSPNVNLTWGASVGVGSYEYCVSTTNNTCATGWVNANTSTSVNPAGLLFSTVYYWQVRAINEYVDAAHPATYADSGTWWTFKTQLTPPAAPILSSPANKSFGTVKNPKLIVLARVGSKSYEYQVSSTPDFSSPAFTAVSTLPYYTLTAAQSLPYGTYYWRAKANYLPTIGSSDWSAPNEFSVTFQTAPANAAYLTTTVKPSFTWLAVAGALEYNLQVARVDTFASTKIDLLQPKAGYASPALDYGTYYWRVRVRTLAGWGDWAPVMKFTLTPPLSAVPVLVSPLTKSVVATKTPTLTWNGGTGDDKYEIQIDNLSTFASPEQTVVTVTGALSYTATTLPDGLYYWRVRTSNYLSVPGAWSVARYFTIDTTAPLAPVLSKPLIDAPVAGTTAFSWLTAATANFYRFQYANESGFTTGVYTYELAALTHTPPAMPLGSRYWRVQARDAAGNWSLWSTVRTVTINPPAPVAPVLVLPVTGSATKSQTPTFTWSPVGVGTPYTFSYEFQLSNATTFLPAAILKSASGLGTTYTLSDLTLTNRIYYWRVRARNVTPGFTAVDGAWSAYRTLTYDDIAPLAPALSAPAINVSVIGTPIFSWLATSGATKYQFEYDNDINFNSPDAADYMSGDLTVLKHTPPAMAPGTYHWRVRALDAAGNVGPYSIVRKLTILPAPILSTTVPGSATNDQTPEFNWDAVTSATTYEINIDTTATFALPLIHSGTSTGITYTTTPTLSPGIYYWRVRALNGAVIGAWSAYRSFTVDLTPPLAPALSLPVVNATLTTTTPAFKWLSAATAVKYEFEYADNLGFGSAYHPGQQTTLTHNPPAMNFGTYYWHVRALDTAGNVGPWSVYRMVTINPPLPTAPVLSAPINALATKETPIFDWNDVTGIGITYEIQISTVSTFLSTVQAPVAFSSSTYAATPLSTDGLYYWRVRAKNSNGQPGLWSLTRSFTLDTAAPLSAPALSSPLNNATVIGIPTFKWTAVAGAAKYQLEYDDDMNFGSSITPAEQTTLAYTPPTLVMPGTYWWRVQAKDAAGNVGPFSATVYKVTVTPPTPLTTVVTAPANLLITKNQTPDFTWKAVAGIGIRYEIQISTVSTFLSTVQAPSLSPLTNYTAATLPEGLYYWRVRAINTAGTPSLLWSTVRSFTIDTTPPVNAPVLTLANLPADNANVLGTPSFSWPSTIGAYRYQFEYDNDANFSSPTYTSGDLTVLKYIPPTMSLGTYYWHVRIKDAAGNEGEWSTPARAITVTPLVPKGVPALLTPVNGSVIPGFTPTMTWGAVTEAVSYDVEMDMNSTFSSPELSGNYPTTSITPTLTEGTYYWRVRKVDTYGGKGIWSLVRRLSVNESMPLALSASGIGLSALSDTPVFTWAPIPNAVTYQIQVDNNAGFTSPEFDDTAESTSRTPVTPLANGIYYWRVRSFTADNTPGEWSQSQTATIAAP